MSADEANNGAAAVQQEQQQLLQQQQQDAGIPQLPGEGQGLSDGLHAGGLAEGYDNRSYEEQQQQQQQQQDEQQQQEQQQQQQAEAQPQTTMTEEERTARKIFVGGLNRNTTADSLRQYFSTFGPVHHTEVLFDKLTGRSRGFGFVTFEDIETINNVVDRHHTIDDSQVEVRRAIPREEARTAQPRRERETTENSGRVFIGGLGDDVTDEVLKEFFSRFGELTSASVMVDRETNRPRGFGFIIYKNPEDAEKALGIHKDLGPNAEAKRAQPRSQTSRMRMFGVGGYPMSGPYRYEDPRFAVARSGYGGAGGPQMYGGYNYAYHPYYAAYYAQMAAAYGGGGSYGYTQSPGEGLDRAGGRLHPPSRSTPY